MKLLVVFKLLLFAASFGNAARILGVFPMPSYSHQIVYLSIMKELANRGHEVVVITTDPLKEDIKNFKQIDVSRAYEISHKHNVTEVINESGSDPLKQVNYFLRMINDTAVYELEHPEVQKLIHNEHEHFDLVMIEFLIPTFLAFKHRFNCPMIALTSMDSSYYGHVAVGNPVHAVLYPEVILPFHTNKLSFFERLISFVIVQFTKYYFELKINPIEDNRVAKYFGSNYPKSMELVASVDMLFINVNYIFHTIRPLTPATITIGPFIHMKPPKDLPKDLKLFLDEAKEGVIYFSLGSNVKSKDIPVETRDVIMKTFAQLPHKILWKFESENLPGKPDNVKIVKWISQQDVLRHENIKLFISQCGLQSMEESLYNYVPVLGLPFFGDQSHNAYKLESNGLGLSLNHKELTIEKFAFTINELVNNPKYKNKVTEVSNLLKDQPMSGLERSVWWTEYVLRNKGAQHLKGPAVDIPTYQYYYLDIITFMFIILVLIISVIYFSVRKCFTFVSRKTKQD